MKLIGLMPVRNEAWCLGLSARVALEWCDRLIIYLHACTDDSQRIARDIFAESGQRVTICHQLDPKWDEMRHRQEMLEIARASLAATHIAMIDADEIATANIVGKIREYVEKIPSGEILCLPLYNLRGGLNRFHADGLWGNRIVSVAFRDEPAFHWAGDTFHSREPRGLPRKLWPVNNLNGGVMHLWGASEQRLLAKHALYKITERLRWPLKPVADIDREYSLCVTGWHSGEAATWKYAAVPPEWWQSYEERGWMQYLDIDAEPWQPAECQRIVAEHGREKFEGLDLFGVA